MIDHVGRRIEKTGGPAESGAHVQPESLLIVLPNWVGDLVLATPVLRTIRQRLPAARICHLLRPGLEDVLYGCGWADEVLLWPPAGPRGFLALANQLRRRRFSTTVLLTNSFRTALLVRLAGSPRRVGYARDWRGSLLTERLAVPREARRPRVESMLVYYARLAHSLGCGEPRGPVELRRDALSEEVVERWWQAGSLGDGRPVIALNPGGRFGASKLYPAESFAAVADRLARDHDAHILITGGPEDSAAVQAVAGAMTAPALVLVPPEMTLRRLKSVLARAALLITNDTGARHVAIAMGTPVITLFGPTHPGWTETHFALERKIQVQIACGPCQQPICPLGHNVCMKLITPDMVVASAQDLLRWRHPVGAC